jgi:PilZ domain
VPETHTSPPVATRLRRPANNRAMVRYRCAPATIGRLYVGEDHEFQHAWVANLSQNGVAFVLARSIPSGTPILIQIRGIANPVLYGLPAQVVHCTEQLEGDWMIGCSFEEPLSTELLDNLL